MSMEGRAKRDEVMRKRRLSDGISEEIETYALRRRLQHRRLNMPTEK